MKNGRMFNEANASFIGNKNAEHYAMAASLSALLQISASKKPIDWEQMNNNVTLLFALIEKAQESDQITSDQYDELSGMVNSWDSFYTYYGKASPVSKYVPDRNFENNSKPTL